MKISRRLDSTAEDCRSEIRPPRENERGSKARNASLALSPAAMGWEESERSVHKSTASQLAGSLASMRERIFDLPGRIRKSIKPWQTNIQTRLSPHFRDHNSRLATRTMLAVPRISESCDPNGPLIFILGWRIALPRFPSR